jgi:hypothetical protein
MKKSFFVFKPHSISGIISNSSSTMFVFKNVRTKLLLESLIKNIYPNYLDEYYELQCVSDLDNKNFITYLEEDVINSDRAFDNGIVYGILRVDNIHFYIHLCYKTNISPFDLYTNWKECCDAIASENNVALKFSDKGLELIKQKFSDVYVLFSRDENPNYEMKTELELIGTHYYGLESFLLINE